MSKKQTRITVNVREDEYEELAVLAEKHDVSLSRLARQALCEFLQTHGNIEPPHAPHLLSQQKDS